VVLDYEAHQEEETIPQAAATRAPSTRPQEHNARPAIPASPAADVDSIGDSVIYDEGAEAFDADSLSK